MLPRVMTGEFKPIRFSVLIGLPAIVACGQAAVTTAHSAVATRFAGDLPSLKLRRGGHARHYPPSRIYGEAGISTVTSPYGSTSEFSNDVTAR
jgi:hypothetical protein